MKLKNEGVMGSGHNFPRERLLVFTTKLTLSYLAFLVAREGDPDKDLEEVIEVQPSDASRSCCVGHPRHVNITDVDHRYEHLGCESKVAREPHKV